MGRPKKNLAEVLEAAPVESTERGFKRSRFAVTLKLLQPMLGTIPQTDIFVNHVAAKQAKELKRTTDKTPEQIKEEIESTIEGAAALEQMEIGKTSFFYDNGGFYIRDYMIRGMLKNAAKVLKQYGETKQLKSKVSDNLFVRPLKIYVAKPDAKLEELTRPLRAETPQGPRTCIARSDMVPEGTEISFTIELFGSVVSEALIRELLSYGEFSGLGQWRNGSYGSFEVLKLTKVS